MRRFLSVSLQLFFILSVLILLLSAILWSLARFWWGYTLANYSFLDLLGLGLIRFWQDGPGFSFIGVASALAVYFTLDWLTDLWSLKSKQNALNRDIEKQAAELAAAMRKGIEAQVMQAHQNAIAQMRQWENRLGAKEEELRERELKVDAYLEELKALRRSHTRYNLEFTEIRRRAQQAINALTRDVPVVGEAKRLLEKIIQLA